MSHFCLLVVTESRPTEEILIEALAPYHEFESTGDSNEYVKDIDKTEEYKEEYEKYKVEGQSLVEYIKDEYDYETVLLEVDLDYEGEHKWGYIVVDLEGNVEKIVRRTNPNKRWDWWQVGGRLSEFLVAKPHVFNYPRDEVNIPSIGEPGLMGSKSQNDGFDIIRKGDVDFEAMRAKSRERGLAIYDSVYEVVEHLDDFIPWPRMREMYDKVDRARDAYNNQRAKIAINEYNNNGGRMHFLNLEDYMCSRDEYAKQCEDGAVTIFAVLKDGQWYERGKMGWWGDAIPDDHWLSIIDCHI